MTVFLLVATLALFVAQTLSIKWQLAPHLAQKMLINGAACALAGLGLLAFGLLRPGLLIATGATLRYAVAFGVLFALVLLGYNMALASGPMSYTAFYFSSSMIIPALLGMLLFSEPVRVGILVALALFLGAFYCMNVPSGGEKAATTRRWRLLCLFVFLGNGGLAVLQKAQQKASGGTQAIGFMLVGFAVAVCCYGVMYAFLRKKLPPAAPRAAAVLHRNFGPALLLGAGSVGGNLLLTFLVGKLPASYLYPLVQGGVLLCVALCARFLYREKLSLRAKLGVSLAIAGMVAINL